MDHAAALAVLDLHSLPPADVLEAHLEETVFPIRAYFLRNTVVPALFNARSRRLSKYAEAAEALGLPQKPFSVEVKALDQDTDQLEELLRRYGFALGECRLKMASTLNPRELIALAHVAIDIQKSYEQHFLRLTDAHPEQENVLAADQYDSGKLLLHLTENEEERIQGAIAQERGRILAMRATGRQI